MSISLNRVIVSVADLARSRTFYREMLGLTEVTAHGDLAVFKIGDGLDLNLHQRPSSPSDTAVAVSFVVDDLDGLCARWKQTGGQIIDEPEDRPWGERMAVVRDPDGHLVCLVQGRS